MFNTQLLKKKKKAQIVAFVDFHGDNIPAMASF